MLDEYLISNISQPLTLFTYYIIHDRIIPALLRFTGRTDRYCKTDTVANRLLIILFSECFARYFFS